MTQLRFISEDSTYKIFESFYHEIPVRFMYNKLTDVIKIDVDACAKCLGFDSINEMLSTNEGLDFIIESKKENPNRQLFGALESGAIFESTNVMNKT